MPAFIGGSLQLNNIAGNGIVQFGDTLVISPKIASKTPVGSGGANTAAIVLTTTGVSGTNFIDPNVVDQPIINDI